MARLRVKIGQEGLLTTLLAGITHLKCRRLQVDLAAVLSQAHRDASRLWKWVTTTLNLLAGPHLKQPRLSVLKSGNASVLLDNGEHQARRNHHQLNLQRTDFDMTTKCMAAKAVLATPMTITFTEPVVAKRSVNAADALKMSAKRIALESFMAQFRNGVNLILPSQRQRQSLCPSDMCGQLLSQRAGPLLLESLLLVLLDR
jgi:hypothetical protein